MLWNTGYRLYWNVKWKPTYKSEVKEAAPVYASYKI